METLSHRFEPIPPTHPFAETMRRLRALTPWSYASEHDLFALHGSGGDAIGYVCFLGARFADRGFAIFETRAHHRSFLDAIEGNPDADIPPVPAVYAFFADPDEEPPSPLLLTARGDGAVTDPEPLHAIFATVCAPALIQLMVRRTDGRWRDARIEIASPDLRTTFELRPATLLA